MNIDRASPGLGPCKLTCPLQLPVRLQQGSLCDSSSLTVHQYGDKRASLRPPTIDDGRQNFGPGNDHLVTRTAHFGDYEIAASISEPLQIRDQVDGGVEPSRVMWEQEAASKQITKRSPIVCLREGESDNTGARITSLTLELNSH